MIRAMGFALRSIERGPIAQPPPGRIHPPFAHFHNVSCLKISNICRGERFAFANISQGANPRLIGQGVRISL
jgi:hypothetical protein